MFNDILTEAGEPILSKPYLEYLPTVDYSYFHTKDVDKFISEHKDQKKVLICNGNVQSLQAFNFSFMNTIYSLAYKYKDIVFIITQGLPVQEDNIFPTDYVIKSEGGFDLNEISYLANFVDIIIGRKSGPFVFAHPKEVWYSNKKSLSFTYGREASHFVLEDTLPLRKFWSPAQDEQEVLKVIEDVINA